MKKKKAIQHETKSLSSIHIQKANRNCFKHNAREEDNQAQTINEEFSKNNTCEMNSKEAQEIFDKLYEERSSKNPHRTAKKENTLIEAVLNIEPDTTLEELKEVSDYIEKEFKFKLIQTAIHKDEGHKQDELLKVNYHSHMVFISLDENGKQMNRREHINREKLSKLQDFTAQALNMERGKENSTAKRLSHKDFKEHKKRTEPLKEQINMLEHRHERVLELAQVHDERQKELEEELEKIKEAENQLKIDLEIQKDENLRLREELQEQEATRTQYAQLEQENRDKIQDLKNEKEQLKKDKEQWKGWANELQKEVKQLRPQKKEISMEI